MEANYPLHTIYFFFLLGGKLNERVKQKKRYLKSQRKCLSFFFPLLNEFYN